MVHHSAFCDATGTLNMILLEYSDFAVFLLALHTALIILSPKCCQGRGLCPFRYYIAVFYLLIPCVFAVICLTPMSSEVRSAYTYLSTWRYFRFFPEWYRYAFSWGPRLFITAAIVVLYFVIYYHVKTEINAIEKAMPSVGSVDIRPEGRVRHGHYLKCCRSLTSSTVSLRKWLSQFPGLNFLYPYGITAVTGIDGHILGPTVVTFADGDLAVQTNVPELQKFLNSETYIRFKRRRADIERQITFLFIYPAVYVFIYSFQLTQQVLYYSHDENSLLAKDVITYIADSLRPANGAINSLVFYWKESQSQQLLDRVDRLAYAVYSGEPVTIDPDHDLNIQIGFGSYSSQGSDIPSSVDTTHDIDQPPAGKFGQWAIRVRNFRFRPCSDEEKAIERTAEVKRSSSMMPKREEGIYRCSHEESDREGIEELDLTGFLRQ